MQTETGLMSVAAWCEQMGITEQTLRNYRRAGVAPPIKAVGQRRYVVVGSQEYQDWLLEAHDELAASQ